MFGYVTVNKPELKIKDFERYHAFYCGLCRTLKKQHGRSGQMTLTYDMTFLIILLTSLYEQTPKRERHSCVVHPLKKHTMFSNAITEYAADMNIALSYEHFRDDWEDEKKISGILGSKLFQGKYKRIVRKYPRQCGAIQKSLKELTECEQRDEQDIDTICRPFGELMAEMMVYQEDAFAPTLRKIGFYLGKFIYLMDAYMDLGQDRKKGCYNPFLQRSYEDGFDEWSSQLLMLMIAEASKEFEKLPLEWDIDILRNILYDGVWSRYQKK